MSPERLASAPGVMLTLPSSNFGASGPTGSKSEIKMFVWFRLKKSESSGQHFITPPLRALWKTRRVRIRGE
jgi:hypothetical protein